MILFSMGLPGRFTAWCEAVLMRLVGQTGGQVAATVYPPLNNIFGYETIAPTLAELARILISNTARHVVIGARQPDDGLRQILVAANVRFLVALDDPRNAVADILAETGAPPRDAVRAIANTCSLIMPYDAMPGALVLRAQDAGDDPARAVAAIAAHFGIAVDPGAAEAIAAELAALAAGPAPDPELPARLPAGIGKMLDGALLAYRNQFFDGHLGEIVWTRDLFHLGLDPSRGPTEPIDLAGGSRILIYGPYIHLPPGSWTARVVLGFSPAATDATFVVDVFADGQVACSTFRPDTPGIYSAELHFSIGGAVGKGVEVRVTVASDNAQGQLAFGHVVMVPLAVRRADAATRDDADFTVVLAL